jgi:CRP-like cAMP-binding protein
MSNLPARTRSFAHGDTLLQAGGDHEVGYVILSGLVELRKETGALVENAEQGAVIGATSLLFGSAQEFNAIAKGPVEAATIDRATVSAQLSRNPDLVREFSSMLLGRLELVPKAERDTVPVSHEGPIAAPGTWTDLRLKPSTSTTRSELPRRGVPITEYPFVVGRKPLRHEHAPRSHVALMFPDSKPYNLSRNHFAIEKGHTALMIRDVGSHLGTVVNGVRIGIDEPLNAVALHIGENEVMAGGSDSPFQFIIEITR